MTRLAAGRLNGVAPNADLYLVKFKGQYMTNAGEPKNSVHNYLSLEWFVGKIENHIETRRNENPNAKFVINWSGGK
jgi:hypothetical protein